MKVIISLLVIIIGPLWSIMILVKNNGYNYSDIALKDCQEDEFKGYIPKGSCSCAKELFSDFSKSYDWMDACDVLNSQKTRLSP